MSLSEVCDRIRMSLRYSVLMLRLACIYYKYYNYPLWSKGAKYKQKEVWRVKMIRWRLSSLSAVSSYQRLNFHSEELPFWERGPRKGPHCRSWWIDYSLTFFSQSVNLMSFVERQSIYWYVFYYFLPFSKNGQLFFLPPLLSLASPAAFFFPPFPSAL